MANDDERIHIAITYIKSLHLPEIPKPGIRTTLRRLYAVLSIEDAAYEMSSLDPQAYATRPMTFLSKPSGALSLKLFAKRNRHDDILLAEARVRVDDLVSDADSEVTLIPSASLQLVENPILVLKMTISDRFTDRDKVETIRSSLGINSKLIRTFGYISLLVQIGTAIAELNPIAKAVMGLVGIANSKLDEILKRNESVLQLVEDVGNAIMLVIDWDDSELDEQRPHQRRVCQELLPEIYRCFHLLWTLTEGKLAARLSKETIQTVCDRRTELLALVERMKSNTLLDTQEAVFRVSAKVTAIHDRDTIDRLRYAKDAVTSASKACLPDTRIALLAKIEDWALHPTRERALLLHGAAGKGKSAIAHTIARDLESQGLAVMPFFAFNRSVLDRSPSQLIPTWAMQLAESNSQYLRYLHSLPRRRLESSDVVDQRDNLLIRGLAGLTSGTPIIFIIDALDECPKGEANSLLRLLHDLLSRLDLPPFIRFLFTYRPDGDILSTFDSIPARRISIDDEEGTAEDIRKFVHNQLHDKPEVAHMVDDVAKAAQTLFECAAVLCRELTSTRRPISTSAREAFVRRMREGPVMSLYASYYAILEMYFGDGDAQMVKLFRRVMAWVLLVTTPQPRPVFRAFAAAFLPDKERPDADTILSWLGSLLSGTASEHEPITPLHTSLRDFLLDARHSRAFSIDLGHHSQKELAWACLRIMNTGLEFNICKLPTSFALNSEIEDLPQRVKEHISPGLRYACLATAQHLRSTLRSSTTITRRLSNPVSPRPSVKALVGIACVIMIYMNISLAILFLAAVLLYSYHDQGKAPDIAHELNSFLRHKFLYWLEAHSCMQTE